MLVELYDGDRSFKCQNNPLSSASRLYEGPDSIHPNRQTKFSATHRRAT